MINKIASMILYVPFNNDYVVDPIIKETMSEDEFFNECYVEMNIKALLKKAKNANLNEFEQDDEDITKEESKKETIERLEKLKRDIDDFERWINNSGNAIYCIKGNAGTGKSTYLHYLKHNRKDINWEIIDIQKARERVDIIRYPLEIPHFKLLDYKVISSMLDNILSYFFPKNDKGKHEYALIKENIIKLYQEYKNVQEDFPNEIVEVFFENSLLFNKQVSEIQKKDISEYSYNIYIYLLKLLNTKTSFSIMDELWTLYMKVLEAKNNKKKHIIAFDNFERFIGADEICNKQLWNFIEEMRHILQACERMSDTFTQHFQMILFMRNTTSRMGNVPLQLLDFGGHELDLSDWFPINQIVNKKLIWYENKKIPVPYSEILGLILGNKSFDGNGMRSLQTKLSKLYNYNKRVLIRLLTEMISIGDNTYLNKFQDYAKNHVVNVPALDKFAGRTIIIRLVLDMLQDDNFFKNICVDKNETKKGEESEAQKEESYERLGIARKILTILYTHSLHHEEGYMLFDDLIRTYRNEGAQSVDNYFDRNNRTKRKRISKILYHMNYYNGRKWEWMHFIDIQYNPSNNNMLFFASNEDELDEMIKEHHEEIGIRIMPAGRAYLQYIVHSFEYFACRNSKQIPPLLALIPELNEIDNCKDVLELKCFDAIDNVLEDVENCISHMSSVENNNRILYRRSLISTEKKHSDRIIDSHIGFINNFRECITKKFKDIPMTSDRQEKFNTLYTELEIRMRKYENLRGE